MGDPKSGNTVSTSNSSSTSTSGPHPYITPQIQNLAGQATGWMNNNMTAPGYFPGGTVAAPSPFSTSARDQTWGYAQSGINSLGSSFAPAIGYLTDAASGKYLDVANDPYWQRALEASFRPATEQFRDVLAPGIDSTFAGSGRTAGGAHFDTMMRGVNDLTRNQSDAAAKAAADRYSTERGLQAGAATALPGTLGSLQGQAGGWLGMLQGVGAGDTDYRQRLLDDENAKFGYDSTAQLDWYNRLAQTLLGMHPGGQTTGSSSGTSYGTGSQGGGGGVGSFLGPALSVAGMALPFLSDRRDKEDIQKLGVDPLTGLAQYAYRYKGDPKNTPKIVGPMAQDAEEKYPHLVREIGGHKIVSPALLPSGGLL